jgi:hypothetical protein
MFFIYSQKLSIIIKNQQFINKNIKKILCIKKNL